MKSVAALVGLGMIAVGAYNFSVATTPEAESAAPLFDYKSASFKDRHAWLKEQAGSLEYSVQRALGTTTPTLSHLNYKETKVSAKSSEVSYIAQLSRFANGRFPNDMKQKLRDRLCPRYVKTPFFDNKINMTVRVVRRDGSTAFSKTYGASACRRYKDKTG